MESTASDILIKSAEMIDPDHWCSGVYFKDMRDLFSNLRSRLQHTPFWESPELIQESELDEALASKRCVTGTIATATVLLGGSQPEFSVAMGKFQAWLQEFCSCKSVIQHNDSCLKTLYGPSTSEQALGLREDVRAAALWNGLYGPLALSTLPPPSGPPSDAWSKSYPELKYTEVFAQKHLDHYQGFLQGSILFKNINVS